MCTKSFFLIFQTTQNVEYLKEHISKIISQNEAIMEVVEPALQKKYHKITGISRGLVINENSSSKLAMAVLKQREESLNSLANKNGPTVQPDGAIAGCSNSSANNAIGPSGVRRVLPSLQQQAQHVLQTQVYQPLNLTTSAETSDMLRKRCLSEGFTGQEIASHPQNPERSIIKDLLLNSRKMAAAAAAAAAANVAASTATSTGDVATTEDTIFACSLCKITFRSADNLKYHTKNYCQGVVANSLGESPQSAPISPVASPSHKYFRSNSFNVNLPEKYNPNTLAKLASCTLKHPSQTPMSLAKLAQTHIKVPKTKPDNIVIITDSHTMQQQSMPYDSTTSSQLTKLFDTSLPSPGPLLGKTRLVDTHNNARKNDEATISHVLLLPDDNKSCKSMVADDKYGQHVKRPRFDSYSLGSPSFLSNSSDLASLSHGKNLPMCGGEIKIVEKREETAPRFGSSGGSIVSISPSPDAIGDGTSISIGIRTGLHSGGSTVELLPNTTSTKQIPTFTLTPAYDLSSSRAQTNRYFQFPPINSITGYNPLTLPPIVSDASMPSASTILHDGRMIPFVPGIPGPHSLVLKPPEFSPKPTLKFSTGMSMSVPIKVHGRYNRGISPAPSVSPLTLTPKQHIDVPMDGGGVVDNLLPRLHTPTKADEISYVHTQPYSAAYTKRDIREKKSFNFSRMADNISPAKPTIDRVHSAKLVRTTPEPIFFNFDTTTTATNYPTKPNVVAAITLAQPVAQSPSNALHVAQPENKHQPSNRSPLHIDVTFSPPSQMVTPKELSTTSVVDQQQSTKSSRFLRPTSLPLKPGTFTPKRHHGITPTANTLPLISPETPRPSKNCIQLYLNGHAYTYLGLKCSTKTFYCTVNRSQPVHFTSQPKLSIYSNWQTCAESDPHPMGLSPKQVMSLYDSRHRPTKYSVARLSPTCTILHSQSLMVALSNQSDNFGKTYQENQHDQQLHNVGGTHCTTGGLAMSTGTMLAGKCDRTAALPTVPGGYESNEDYTYVRGRGRGRYVCSQCGIRCKKPSMLKKHIKTHSNERPYTCKYCIIR